MDTLTYYKKPVVIAAEQVRLENIDRLAELPDRYSRVTQQGLFGPHVHQLTLPVKSHFVDIKTALIGDYILSFENGSYYDTVSEEQFKAEYEPYYEFDSDVYISRQFSVEAAEAMKHNLKDIAEWSGGQTLSSKNRYGEALTHGVVFPVESRHLLEMFVLQGEYIFKRPTGELDVLSADEFLSEFYLLADEEEDDDE